MRQLKITKTITNRESVSLDKYLSEIGRVEPLTYEKEVELAQKIRQGDAKSLDILVKANLRFVVSVAKQYQNQGLALSDLINEGNLGIIKAAKKYDETRGFKFISYAVWWIRQSILQALAEQSRIVRLPLNQLGDINRMSRYVSRFEQDHDREPSNEEIAKELSLNTDKVQALRNHGTRSHSHMSLDKETVPGEHATLLDMIASSEREANPDFTLNEESTRKLVDTALSCLLSFRESEIIKKYHGIGEKNPWTLEEIGDELELTRERVRQIKEKAEKKLRNSRKLRNLVFS